MKLEKFFVYILQSKKDLSFYIGQTNEITTRLENHNEGGSKYTSSKIPWDLVYFEGYDTRTESVRREKEIKGKKSRKYIEFLISNK